MRKYLATNAFNMQYAFITHRKFAPKYHIIKKLVNKNPDTFNKNPDTFNKNPDTFNKNPDTFNKKLDELTEKRLKEMNRDIFLL